MRAVALRVLLIVAIAALVIMGVRYTRLINASLARTNNQAPAVRSSVKFVKNPTAVPDFVVRDLDGRSISSASLRGKVTIVNFWATWCSPCRAEIPDLIELQEKYKDQLQVIGISVDEAPAEHVRAFVREHRINYPVAMVTSEVRRSFPGVFALPTSFVIDRQGRTVQRHVGLISAEVYDRETRALAGLGDDVEIEEIEDTRQVLLDNAAQATEIPGLDLSPLSPDRRQAVLARLNTDSCVCGCALTLAQCRINDPDCKISLPLARQVVQQMASK